MLQTYINFDLIIFHFLVSCHSATLVLLFYCESTQIMLQINIQIFCFDNFFFVLRFCCNVTYKLNNKIKKIWYKNKIILLPRFLVFVWSFCYNVTYVLFGLKNTNNMRHKKYTARYPGARRHHPHSSTQEIHTNCIQKINIASYFTVR
jgi:hypothetical protein